MLSFTLPTAANILNNSVQKAWKEQQNIQTLRTCHLIISSAAYLCWEQLTCSVSQLRYELQACSFLKVLGKTTIWCENSSPKSTEFPASCSRTNLDPMPFGNFPHPQKHLCTDMQAAHLPWTSSNTELHWSSQSQATDLPLIPSALKSWCRASTKTRLRIMDITFVRALETPISLKFMTDQWNRRQAGNLPWGEIMHSHPRNHRCQPQLCDDCGS